MADETKSGTVLRLVHSSDDMISLPKLSKDAAYMVADLIGGAIIADRDDRDTDGYATSAQLEELRKYAIALLNSVDIEYKFYPEGIDDDPIIPDDSSDDC